jgi:hypothetical protein
MLANCSLLILTMYCENHLPTETTKVNAKPVPIQKFPDIGTQKSKSYKMCNINIQWLFFFFLRNLIQF